jgi:hypothetical protein
LVDASVGPRGSLEMLSQSEIQVLLNSEQGGVHELFRKCALAILNRAARDNAKIFDLYCDLMWWCTPWGIRLQIRNARAALTGR